MPLLLVAMIATSSKALFASSNELANSSDALDTSSDALATSSFYSIGLQDELIASTMQLSTAHTSSDALVTSSDVCY